MPNEPYVEEIMVADGDGDHPSTEEVKYEQKVNLKIEDDLNDIPDSTDNIEDDDKVISQVEGRWYKKTFSKVWSYVQNKIDAVLGLTAEQYDGKADTASIADTVRGSYSGNGGQQPPNHYGVNKVGFLMSNVPVGGDSHYKNLMYMDCYSEDDAGGVTALGLDRMEAKGFILQSDASRTDWNGLTELRTTRYDVQERYGTTGSTTKIKININATSNWMLAFTVHLYQGYKEISVRVSGYQYGTNHWHNPEARVISDSDNDNNPFYVYFGYDADNQLWVGFDGGSYTGISISDVTNGYAQITDYSGLFTISDVSALSTTQVTLYAVKIPSHIGEFIISTTLNTKDKVQQLYGSNTDWLAHSGYCLWAATGSTVVANSAAKTGGANSVTVSSVASHNHTQNSHNHTQDSHNHTQNAHNHSISGLNSYANVASYYGDNKNGLWGSGNNLGSNSISIANKTPTNVAKTATNQAKTATNIANGASYSVSTLPNYKFVNMWERIS